MFIFFLLFYSHFLKYKQNLMCRLFFFWHPFCRQPRVPPIYRKNYTKTFIILIQKFKIKNGNFIIYNNLQKWKKSLIILFINWMIPELLQFLKLVSESQRKQVATCKQRTTLISWRKLRAFPWYQKTNRDH